MIVRGRVQMHILGLRSIEEQSDVQTCLLYSVEGILCKFDGVLKKRDVISIVEISK